jgi:hypothetical protein
MKTYEDVEVWFHTFLMLALGGSGQLHVLAALHPEKESLVSTG